jgi:hypothetical protein
VTEETGFGLAEAFLTPSQRVDSDTMEVVCNACGFTASQLKKIGRMGCPECYSAFSEGLDGLLRNMHKGTRHIGKRPNRNPAAAPQPLPACPCHCRSGTSALLRHPLHRRSIFRSCVKTLIWRCVRSAMRMRHV